MQFTCPKAQEAKKQDGNGNAKVKAKRCASPNVSRRARGTGKVKGSAMARSCSIHAMAIDACMLGTMNNKIYFP